MVIFSITLLMVILVFLANQIKIITSCFRSFKALEPSVIPIESLPKVSVILALRGADPFLERCFTRLMQQDYPNYTVEVIVDSQTDPAWEIVHRVCRRQGATHVRVKSLERVYETCSLKCSSIIQAISGLDDTYDFFALVDGDFDLHPTWLRELITPLVLDQSLAATTGNRWHAQDGKYWGSRVRYLWSVAAFTHIYLSNMPSGGSLAVRTEVLRQTNLLELLKHSLSDDLTIGQVLQEHDLKLGFVPSLLVRNAEECRLSDVLPFFKRQILWARLYNPRWKIIVAQGGLSMVLLPAIALLGILHLLEGNLGLGLLMLAALVFYGLFQITLVVLWEKKFRAVTQSRYAPSENFSGIVLARLLAALPLTILLNSIAVFSVCFTQTVKWRKVTYAFQSAYEVKLLGYQPYQSDLEEKDVEISLA
jgi:glycosyltransferase involved in cell wall biosynthesis